MPATDMKLTKDKKDGAVKGKSKNTKDDKVATKGVKKNNNPMPKPKKKGY